MPYSQTLWYCSVCGCKFGSDKEAAQTCENSHAISQSVTAADYRKESTYPYEIRVLFSNGQHKEYRMIRERVEFR